MRESSGGTRLMSDVVDSLRATAMRAERQLRKRKGRRRASFAEIAIEFQCRMSPQWNERRKSADILLNLGRPRFAWLDRRPVQRIRIVCRRDDAWEPRLYVNENDETSAAALAAQSHSSKEGEGT